MYKLGTGIFIFWSFWKNVSLDLSTSFTKTNFMVEIMSFKARLSNGLYLQWKCQKIIFLSWKTEICISPIKWLTVTYYSFVKFSHLKNIQWKKLTSIWCYIYPMNGSTQVSWVPKLFSSVYVKLGVRFLKKYDTT